MDTAEHSNHRVDGARITQTNDHERAGAERLAAAPHDGGHASRPGKPSHGRGRKWIAPILMFAALIGLGGMLAAWKQASWADAAAAAANQPEPMELIQVDHARAREHSRTTTSIGTVRALRSITLKTEVAGAVRESMLEPGAIVEAGTVLVALDVSVEEAELAAQEARAELARTQLERLERASQTRGASQSDVDRARAEREVALAETARTKAVIEKKSIRAPFRARVGMSDVHPGQYFEEGAELTTLQGVDDAVHVDFSVAQSVAAGLQPGQRIQVVPSSAGAPLEASIVAIDARVDPATRNAWIRARLEGALLPAPGASVVVRTPIGAPRTAVAVSVSAVRKGPDGNHVFVVTPDDRGNLRAHQRRVTTGPVVGDEILILEGLEEGEQVAASGSFKLRESVLVAVHDAPAAGN